MRHGRDRRLLRLYEVEARRGRRTPLEDAPVLIEPLMVYWRMWVELHPKRTVSQGWEGDVPGTEIDSWLDRHGFDDPEIRLEAHEILADLDHEYREILDEDRKDRRAEEERQRSIGAGRSAGRS
uniref:Uncharacterized protein n=1 Tax=viral metagenome TaxID=1070528 RepID=A0A6M3JLJ0_9ZZZZ